jgi:hypothetical protein
VKKKGGKQTMFKTAIPVAANTPVPMPGGITDISDSHTLSRHNLHSQHPEPIQHKLQYTAQHCNQKSGEIFEGDHTPTSEVQSRR